MGAQPDGSAARWERSPMGASRERSPMGAQPDGQELHGQRLCSLRLHHRPRRPPSRGKQDPPAIKRRCIVVSNLVQSGKENITICCF